MAEVKLFVFLFVIKLFLNCSCSIYVWMSLIVLLIYCACFFYDLFSVLKSLFAVVFADVTGIGIMDILMR